MAGDYIITGGRPLNGTVRVPAAKNSVLPLLAASLLCSGPVRLCGVPELADVAESLGLRAAPLTALAGLAPAFDTVVNTVPARVLTAPVLAALRPGSLIVDLASKPGGTDFDAARRLGHKVIHALSLPAVCAP